MKKRLAFMSSGSGSLTKSILQAISDGVLDSITPVALISDRESSSITVGKEAGLKTFAIQYKMFANRQVFSDKILEILQEENIDFCFLTFDRILSGAILREFQNKLINIHPSLLPLFPGYNTTERAMDSGCRFVGATCHFLDEGTDTGQIINQCVLPFSPLESVDEVNHKLFKLRIQLSIQALYAFSHDLIRITDNNILIDTAKYNSLPINPMVTVQGSNDFLQRYA